MSINIVLSIILIKLNLLLFKIILIILRISSCFKFKMIIFIIQFLRWYLLSRNIIHLIYSLKLKIRLISPIQILKSCILKFTCLLWVNKRKLIILYILIFNSAHAFELIIVSTLRVFLFHCIAAINWLKILFLYLLI